MENNETRITRLEEQYKNIDEKVDAIINNHLPHLSKGVEDITKEVAEIKNKLALWSGAIIVLGWFGQFVLDKILK